MKHLARAIVDAFAFLELSDEETVDPDDAVGAMEMLSATLRDCTAAELKALRTAAAAALKDEIAGRNCEEAKTFFETFMDEFD